MAKVMAILVMCDSNDLGGIVNDFMRQWQGDKVEIKADYVKPLVVSDTIKEAVKNIKKLTTTEHKIMDYIKEHEGFAVVSDLKEAKITADGHLYRSLEKMVERGVLIKTGRYGSHCYELAEREES